MLIESTAYIRFKGIVTDPTMDVVASACTVARVGVGIYDVTLDRALSPQEAVFQTTVGINLGVPETSICNIEHLTDTVKRVRVYNTIGGGPPPFPLSDTFVAEIGFMVAVR